MLLVDIVVPIFSRKYHFTLDETVNVELLITEIVTVIEQKEQCKLMGRREKMVLCRNKTKEVLIKNRNLQFQGVKNGEDLMLI